MKQTIVIFDMDGTLVDSKKDITISINYVRELNHHLPPLSEAFVVKAINMEERNLPKLFYGTECYEKRDKLAFEQHYKEQCSKNPSLYDGVFETLETLNKKGINLSVATNAPTIFAKTILRSLHIADMFDCIIGADAVKKSKPSPDMLNKILEQYHYDAQRDTAWMVGDNSKDMLSAKNANIEAIFATWGFSPQPEYHRFVQTPQKIIEIVL